MAYFQVRTVSFREGTNHLSFLFWGFYTHPKHRCLQNHPTCWIFVDPKDLRRKPTFLKPTNGDLVQMIMFLFKVFLFLNVPCYFFRTFFQPGAFYLPLVSKKPGSCGCAIRSGIGQDHHWVSTGAMPYFGTLLCPICIVSTSNFCTNNGSKGTLPYSWSWRIPRSIVSLPETGGIF